MSVVQYRKCGKWWGGRKDGREQGGKVKKLTDVDPLNILLRYVTRHID